MKLGYEFQTYAAFLLIISAATLHSFQYDLAAFIAALTGVIIASKSVADFHIQEVENQG